MAAHLALEGGTKKENCIKLESVRDWEDVDWSLRCFNTVIIDDIFGGISLDHERLREWKTVLNDIEQATKDKTLRVIITSRQYIKEEARYEMDKVTMFFDTVGYTVHLDSRDLSSGEMEQILSTVLERNGIDRNDVDVGLCVTKAKGAFNNRSDERDDCVFGFPECAVLFATETLICHGFEFFKSPEYHFKAYIEQLYKPNDKDQFYKFIALVAVWAEKNHTIKETDLQNPENVSSHIQNIAHCFGIKINYKFVETVKFALNAYTKFLVLFKKDSGMYTFSHNVIGEMVGIVLGNYKPRECIQLCQRDFLMRRVTIDGTRKSDLQILVQEYMYRNLCEKFIEVLTRKEWSGEQQSERVLDSVNTLTNTSINERIEVDLDILKHEAFGINSFKEFFTKHIVFKDLVFRLSNNKVVRFKVRLCNDRFSYPLIVATRLNQRQAVKFLLEHGACINLKDSDGQTALICAAINTHYEIMKELLNSKADVNVSDNSGKTALHIAVEYGHLDAVKWCLKYRADLKIVNKDKQTALHIAASRGHSIVMQELLDSMADVKSSYLLHAMDNTKKTPLYYAAQNGHLNTVITCLKTGAYMYVNKRYEKNAALLIAASRGHSDVMEALLDGNADLNTEDNTEKTPFDISIENGHLNAVKTCLNFGTDVNKLYKYKRTALHIAASHGYSDVMKELLENKVDVNVRDIRDTTPLHCACDNGHLNAVKTCLKYGADVNLVTNYNRTALHISAFRGHSDMMKELLDSKSDVNVRDCYGRTPLQIAAEVDDLNAVKTCLNYGADVNILNKLNHQSALHESATRGNSDVMKALLDSKADVNARDLFGKTPLHFAARHGHLNAVKTCLSYGADVYLKDIFNETALDYVDSYDAEIITMLQNARRK